MKNEHKLQSERLRSLVAYGSGKRMVTGTRAGSRIKTRNFKRRFLPHHKSQRHDIWCTNSPVVSSLNAKFVERSVPYEAKQRRVTFWRCFGNIPSDVSVTIRWLGPLKQNHMVVAYFPWYFTRRPAWKPLPRRGMRYAISKVTGY